MIYFLIGVFQDFFGAMWAYNVAHKNYSAAVWAGFWASMHVFFVVAVKSGDWLNAIWYCLGVAFGTLLVVLIKRKFPDKGEVHEAQQKG